MPLLPDVTVSQLVALLLAVQVQLLDEGVTVMVLVLLDEATLRLVGDML